MICALFSAELIAQTKTYSGQMIMPKDTPYIPISGTAGYEPGKTKCEATYSYYEKNGQRVKHGRVIYKYIGYSGGISENWIYGAYSHGKKSGQWLFTTGRGLYLDSNGILTTDKRYEPQFYARVTYKDDKLNGPFDMRSQTNEVFYTIAIKGNIKDNRPHGLLKAEVDKLGRRIKVEGKFDEEGNPNGEWKIDRVTGIQRSQTRLYSNGTLMKITEFDSSTGDSNVLFTNTQKSEIFRDIRDINSYKKVEKTFFDTNQYKNATKTFYKSNDGHYFTINEVSLLGESVGKVFKEMEAGLSVIDYEIYTTFGADKAYFLSSADEEFVAIEQQEQFEKDKLELQKRFFALKEIHYQTLQQIVSEAESSENKFNYNQGRWAYFYVNADNIIVKHLKYNPDCREFYIYSGLMGSKEKLIRNVELKNYKSCETEVTELEQQIQDDTALAEKVLEIRKNMKAACPNIGKKNIKKYHQHLVDNKDAEGLIKFFTEGYKQYMP